MIRGLQKYVSSEDWRARWVNSPGMVCVQDLSRPKEKQSWELPNDTQIPLKVDAVGCGGWDSQGILRWVGIDLDVGHGKPEQKYETRDEALEVAFKIRQFVDNAAEIRLSKSGNGVHVRIVVAGNISDGRKKARAIAWWLERTLKFKCDHSALGRQNFWFWAATTTEYSFSLVESAEGEWTPPPEALINPDEIKVAPQPPVLKPPTPISERAAKYVAKIPPSISGSGGHDSAFHCACVLILGFGLTVDEARPIFYDWNRSCQPPWSQKELEHKLSDANKKPGPRGELAKPRNNQKTSRYENQALEESDAPREDAVEQLFDQFEQEANGTRFACKWPWPMIEDMSLALMPGTITMFPAPRGSNKTFFCIQATAFWIEQGYNPALIMLEEDPMFHLRRALAQRIGRSEIASPDYFKRNPAEGARLKSENAEWLKTFNQHLFVKSSGLTTDVVLNTARTCAMNGSRVIVVDPITVRQPSDKPWVDDHKFITGAKEIALEYKTSILLTAHPPVGNKPMSFTDKIIAGGAALENLVSTIFLLEFMEQPESTSVKTASGLFVDVEINRKIQLRKTRSGYGQGFVLGYYFDKKTCLLSEQGVIV